MKLWLLEQNVNTGYDTYDSAIVAATTEAEAKEIHPNIHNKAVTYSDNLSIWDWEGNWCKPKDVQVTYIGTAKPGTNRGVIIASFNAG